MKMDMEMEHEGGKAVDQEKMDKAKEHMDMCKQLVDEAGGDWAEFLDEYSGESEGEGEESSDMGEDMEPGEGNAKKTKALILLLKKKKGM